MAQRKKPAKQWSYSPQAAAKPTVPAAVKAEVIRRADELIERVLKPTHLRPPPEDSRWNYVADLGSKWWRTFFYFTATYATRRPDASVPSFETRFARLEYAGPDRFHLAYMRHTGQWVVLATDLTLDDCLEMIETTPILHP